VGEQAPGCPKGDFFESFTQLALPDQGGVILLATLTGAGVTGANNQGVWAGTSASELRLILRKGNKIPVNNVLKTITALSVLTSSPVTAAQAGGLNSLGNLIYKATFQDGSEGILTVTFPSAQVGEGSHL
jgi:hypothetical protein